MSASKLTWVERVMEFVQGGDKAKVSKLHTIKR
jgi:hypothetical protein